MWEPRGHADMYGVIITPPNDRGADFGAFFIHNEGYSTMCGHALIALAKYAVDSGMIVKHEGPNTMTIDVPAGRISACADGFKGDVTGSSFVNVPSFVFLHKSVIQDDPSGTRGT